MFCCSEAEVGIPKLQCLGRLLLLPSFRCQQFTCDRDFGWITRFDAVIGVVVVGVLCVIDNEIVVLDCGFLREKKIVKVLFIYIRLVAAIIFWIICCVLAKICELFSLEVCKINAKGVHIEIRISSKKVIIG